MNSCWRALLPHKYRNRIVSISSIEHHTDTAANAEKILGFDASGQRCFYYHAFLLQDEHFDIDEFPILVDIYYERVVAWKLRNGNWIRIKSYAEKLDQCAKKLVTLPLETTATL